MEKKGGSFGPVLPYSTGNVTFSSSGTCPKSTLLLTELVEGGPGWAEQTQPSPLDLPALFRSGCLTLAQGLFLVHQLPSLKTSQGSAMNLLCDREDSPPFKGDEE